MKLLTLIETQNITGGYNVTDWEPGEEGYKARSWTYGIDEQDCGVTQWYSNCFEDDLSQCTFVAKFEYCINQSEWN